MGYCRCTKWSLTGRGAWWVKTKITHGKCFVLVSAHQESGKYIEWWLTRLFDKLHIVIIHSSGMTLWPLTEHGVGQYHGNSNNTAIICVGDNRTTASSTLSIYWKLDRACAVLDGHGTNACVREWLQEMATSASTSLSGSATSEYERSMATLRISCLICMAITLTSICLSIKFVHFGVQISIITEQAKVHYLLTLTEQLLSDHLLMDAW